MSAASKSDSKSALATEYLTIHEFIKAAKIRTNAMAWDYLVGGTETETTLRRNRLAIDQIALRPRVLRDVSSCDTATKFMGKTLRLPVLLAPVGSLETFSPEGGPGAAKAAGEFNVGAMMSSVGTMDLEQIKDVKGGLKIYQLYVRGDDAWIDARVERAVKAGYEAFAITVDTAVYSRRERDIAKRFKKSWRTDITGTDCQAALSWKSVEHFKKTHKIPLILKGIGTAEDAKIAIEHGVDAIYVSNHGGRQLDHGRGSLDVLQEVRAAVGPQPKLIVDGGFARGTDIVKAMALGADMVGLGRVYCYALAAAGQAGVVRMLEILEDEMRSCMGLLGVTALKDLNASYLYHGAPVVTPPHVFSAFPLLGLDDPGYGGR
jgi:isopentenyl diphosphate isomerase/L-lactate dehydrogenase-like FMN-dependent dehydrogenase